MDELQRERIREDLKGLLKGSLHFDDLTRALYSTDASIFQVQPLGVAVPVDEEDVQALVRYAAEHQVPLIPRGAGTGMSGEALGSGLVVDLSQHLRRIVSIDNDVVRVQPGVVYRDLQEALAKVGRRFAPDPASGAECTLGGMLATNASGARAVRFGYTRDHVVSLRTVLDNGDAVDIGRLDRAAVVEPGAGRLGDIVFGTVTLLQQNAELIRLCRPATPFNRCGYLLDNVLTPEHVDLARLLVGSEGTLGFFTEATLRTVPLPAGRAVVLFSFTSLDQALRGAREAASAGPTACELLDRRLFTLARSRAAEGPFEAGAEAVLLVEFEAESPAEAGATARALADRLWRTERLALHAETATEPDEIDRLWQLREAALPSLYGIRGGAQPIAFVEDVAVPAEELPVYLHRVQDVLQRHDTVASFFIHAATGQVHTRPFLDLQKQEDLAKLWGIADDIYTLALNLGGTISSQHGTGLARTPWVARQYGRLYPAFRELKTIFDPRLIFNPGKIVGPLPNMPAWPLRKHAPPAASPIAATAESPAAGGNGNGAHGPRPLTTILRWDEGQIRAEALSCNGCGHCRTEAGNQRMCPIFRANHAETATPRAKANLLRYLLQEPGAPPLSSDDVREVADQCVNCKMCATECPAHVNIPKLMLEAKAANVAEHGLDRTDWVLARTESFARVGSALGLFVNQAFANRGVRWLLEKLFGVSRRRRLPTFASRSFLRRADQLGWTRKPRSHRPRVAYFVDVFANYNDPSIAEAVTRVLHHNGVEVFVPPGQLGSGMAPLAYGDVETARETLLRNLRLFSDLAREGFTVLCSEPTAALMFRHDALDLLDDADARIVAERTVEFTDYLWARHESGRLRTDFQRLDVLLGHHVPCHLKALGKSPAGPRLLSLIPGVMTHTIDVNCSGMAGTFGLKAANYELSLAAGKPMLDELRRPRVLFGSTECSTCRLQMEDGAGKRTLHPAQYLALAYGLMPDLADRLRHPIRELVLG